MSEATLDLWSDDIKVDIITPLAVLRAQQAHLRRKTRGLLNVEVTSRTVGEDSVEHQFDLIAPMLDDYRYRVLVAMHKQKLVYPVYVEAECLRPESSAYDGFPPDVIDGPSEAATEQEFLELVGKVLRSPQIRSVIQSLIALSNERRTVSTPPDEENSLDNI